MPRRPLRPGPGDLGKPGDPPTEWEKRVFRDRRPDKAGEANENARMFRAEVAEKSDMKAKLGGSQGLGKPPPRPKQKRGTAKGTPTPWDRKGG